MENYGIELLKERLGELDSSYLEFVINGTVKEDSLVAKENRNKAKDCEKAIKILTEAETIKANLNIADVSNSIKSDKYGRILKLDKRHESPCRYCKYSDKSEVKQPCKGCRERLEENEYYC